MDVSLLQQQLAAAQAENAALRLSAAAAGTTVNNVQTNVQTNTHNTTNNITIVLRNFRDENTAAVHPDTMRSAFTDKVLRPMIEELQENEEEPENHNLRVVDRDNVDVYSKDQWKRVVMDRVITDLVHRSHDILQKFGEDNRGDLLSHGMSVNGFMNRIAEFTLKRHAPGCKKARADVYHALKAKLPPPCAVQPPR